jgi:hypothetical protein
MASAGSAALGYYGQSQTNAANARQAQQQMDFQREMSSTSYQRGVSDMSAAGLNPMLAYSQGGASTPGGATAQMGNEIGQATSSGWQAAQTIAQLDNLESTTSRTRAETERTQAETANALASYAKIVEDTGVSSAQAANLKASTARAQAQLVGDIAESEYSKHSLADRLRETKAGASLAEYELPGAAKRAKYADSPMGWLGPVLHDARGAAETAASVSRFRFRR